MGYTRGEAAARRLADSFQPRLDQFNFEHRASLGFLRGADWKRDYRADPDSFHPIGHIIARFASAEDLWSLRHISGWIPPAGEKDCFGDETGHVFASRPDGSRKLIQASVEAGFVYSNVLNRAHKTALDIATPRDKFVAHAIWHAINGEAGLKVAPQDLNVALKRGGVVPPAQPGIGR